MSTFNRIMILGRLGKDPEQGATSSGLTVAKFSVATDDGTKDKPKTNWHNITVFGKQAENCLKYLSQGRTCLIEGHLDHNKYEKGGETKYFTSIIASSVKFIGSKETNTYQNIASAKVPDDIPF